jgi:hypothetical protein
VTATTSRTESPREAMRELPKLCMTTWPRLGCLARNRLYVTSGRNPTRSTASVACHSVLVVEALVLPSGVHGRKSCVLPLVAFSLSGPSFERGKNERDHRDDERPYRDPVAWIHDVWAMFGPTASAIFNRGAEI